MTRLLAACRRWRHIRRGMAAAEALRELSPQAEARLRRILREEAQRLYP